MCEVLEQGVLGDIPYYVRRLTVEDLHRILDLQQEVVKALPNQDNVRASLRGGIFIYFKGQWIDDWSF